MVIAGMSGMPHCSMTGGPPSSNADIEPTMAKSFWQACSVAARLPPVLVWSSSASTWICRPKMPPWLFAYAAAASVAWNAALKIPGSGPVPS